MVMNGLVSANPTLGKGKFEVTETYAKLAVGDPATRAEWAKKIKGF
jgi:hypothetical protein